MVCCACGTRGGELRTALSVHAPCRVCHASPPRLFAAPQPIPFLLKENERQWANHSSGQLRMVVLQFGNSNTAANLRWQCGPMTAPTEEIGAQASAVRIAT